MGCLCAVPFLVHLILYLPYHWRCAGCLWICRNTCFCWRPSQDHPLLHCFFRGQWVLLHFFRTFCILLFLAFSISPILFAFQFSDVLRYCWIWRRLKGTLRILHPAFFWKFYLILVLFRDVIFLFMKFYIIFICYNIIKLWWQRAKRWSFFWQMPYN